MLLNRVVALRFGNLASELDISCCCCRPCRLRTVYCKERERPVCADSTLFSEIADLHVGTLASSSPVDVISTDRHTVKPWFQGKIPFSFNLPDLQNTEFSLLGGRLAYLDQTPGAQLIYDYRKHHISVFVFQERSLPASLGESFLPPKQLPFNMETWTRDSLRYFVIGDASKDEINRLGSIIQELAH